MHNIGNVDSIGNAIFLAANERLACAHSTLRACKQRNLRFEEKNAHGLLQGILADQIRIADIVVDRTNINRRRSRQLFRDARTKNAAEAMASGIIQAISDPAIPGPCGYSVLRFPSVGSAIDAPLCPHVRHKELSPSIARGGSVKLVKLDSHPTDGESELKPNRSLYRAGASTKRRRPTARETAGLSADAVL